MKAAEKLIIFIYLLFTLQTPLFTQDRRIFFENIREEEGLPYHIVTGIDQDSLGRLWIPTYHGLYQYDGYRYKAYLHSTNDQNSISSNLCRSVLVDRKQRVWLGTESDGFNILDLQTAEIKRFFSPSVCDEKEDVPFSVNHMEEDRKGNVWIASSLGLFRVKYENDSLFVLPIPTLPKSLAVKNITSLLASLENKVWVGTSKGLYAFDIFSKQWQMNEASPLLLETKVSDIIEDKDGLIWIGARDEQGVYQYSDSNNKAIAYPYIANFQKTDRVHLCVDHNGFLWVVAGRSGVYRHHLESKENEFFEGKDYELGPGNFSNFTHSPMLDHFGNIWFCGGGLHKWNNTFKPFTHYRHPLDNYQATAAIYDDEEFRITSLWAKGLVIWNKKQDTFFPLNKEGGLFSNRIYSIVHSVGSSYLIAGEGGCQFVDLETEEMGKHINIKGTIFHGVKENESIILGGSRGLWEIEKQKAQPILSKVNMCYFEKAAQDIYWVATLHSGLMRWNKLSGEKTFYSHQKNQENGIQSNRVEHLNIDHSGVIWLATAAGLESYNPQLDQWTHFVEDKQIAGIRANAVHVIGDNAIWLSNNQGISHLDIREKKWTHYNHKDGLLNTYYYERCSFVNAENRLFFGGRLGVDHFVPSDLQANPIPPKLYFDEIKVDNKLLQPIQTRRDQLTLDWKHRFFEVVFSGVHLTSPSTVSYKYRLLPIQEEWSHISKQSLFFSGTPPGDYKLEIIAFNGDGTTAKKPLVLDIEVKGPLWKKTWFLLICSLLLAAGIFWLFRKTKSNYQNKIQIEQRMNEVERSALRSQMSPHFIFNTMSSIQHFIVAGDEENALKYLSMLSRLIRKVLDYSNESFIPFTEELSLIKDYIRLEQLRFGDEINYVFTISDKIDPEAILIPPMLLQPLVENAINHGLRSDKIQEKKLVLKFEKADDQAIYVHISDNGIGRKNSLQNENKEHKSSGTKNVKNRLQLIGEQLAIPTSFDIIDLYDDFGNAKGTLVKLRIPYT